MSFILYGLIYILSNIIAFINLVAWKKSGILSRWDAIQVRFSPGGILSGWDFVRVRFCPDGILSGWDFVRVGFCPGRILSGWEFARVGFCPGWILNVCLILYVCLIFHYAGHPEFTQINNGPSWRD